MSLISMASPSIPSSCFQPLGQPCEWDNATETCGRRVGIHLLLMKYVIIFSMSVRIKGVGSLFIDGIVVFSVEDSHATPSTPRCWRPRLSCPEIPSLTTSPCLTREPQGHENFRDVNQRNHFAVPIRPQGRSFIALSNNSSLIVQRSSFAIVLPSRMRWTRPTIQRRMVPVPLRIPSHDDVVINLWASPR